MGVSGDANGQKIEVKSSRAYKKISLTEENAIEICTNCSTTVYNINEAENKSSKYDCNIQQLKPDCFQFLYYGVFFYDKIEIFRADRSKIPESTSSFKKNKAATTKNFPGYSVQHKGGDECQFHITRKTHAHHRAKYFYQEMDYDELYDLLTSKK